MSRTCSIHGEKRSPNGILLRAAVKEIELFRDAYMYVHVVAFAVSVVA
jgi:hypothetical protein